MLNSRDNLKWCVPLFLALSFFGALFWAKSDDPFRRVEFTLHPPKGSKVKGICVLPKPVRPRPVVIYLHGSGGGLMESGAALRQFAELGMAAVCIEYDQTNEAAFDEQFVALSRFLNRQPWVVTNEIAWVGFSLGAQNILSFALRHPGTQPQLLVRISGGWIPELDSITNPVVRCPVLIVHGENDQVFSIRDASRLAPLLRKNGISVAERIVPESGHGFDPDRALVLRLTAEYCQSVLAPVGPVRGVLENWKLWLLVDLTPAIGWALFCIYRRRKEGAVDSLVTQLPPDRWTKGIRWVAFILATWALVETGFHLVVPQLDVTDLTLSLARQFLVAPKVMEDFNQLAALPVWRGIPLRVLLENVELANYTRNELANWKVEDQRYRQFVLSPVVDTHSTDDFGWRRALWERFYPRVRREQTPEAAAVIVARFLRERVTIHSGPSSNLGITAIWKCQNTDASGFERIYVAALRSVGIGARLNMSRQAELWTGKKWRDAPHPIVSSFQ